MKVMITMKDPDCLYDPCKEAAAASLRDIEGLDDDEREALQEQRETALRDKLRKWFDCGEYLRVEVDTDAMTATVKPAK